MTNPLAQRLNTLTVAWQNFTQLTDARLCRWLVVADEAWLLDAFLSQPKASDTPTEGLLLPLRSRCETAQGYWLSLANELSRFATEFVARPENEDKHLRWTPVLVQSSTDAPGRFLQMVQDFGKLVAPHLNGSLALCLLPGPDTDLDAFGRFLFLLMSQSWPPSVRVLVRDDAIKPKLDILVGRFGPLVHSTRIDLDLPELVRQAASAGDLAQPDGEFRQHQADFTNTLARRNLPEAERIAALLLPVCSTQKWPALGATVYIGLGQGYADARRFKEAKTRFERAVALTEPAYETGDALAGLTSISVWLGLGGVFERQNERPHALAIYQQATDRADLLNEPVLAIECHRRLSETYLAAEKSDLATAHYDRIFALAEPLTPTQRLQAHLPAIARTYWKTQKTFDQRRLAHIRLKGLLGPNWEP